MKAQFYNTHGHCFTHCHVPEYFFGKWLPVSWLLSSKWFVKLVHQAPVTGRFGFLGSLVKGLVFLLLGFDQSMIVRYLNLVRHCCSVAQNTVIRQLRAYYPKNTGTVLLTMDMEYMGAGLPKIRFEQQLDELAEQKFDPEFGHLIFPFVCCDPRRLQPQCEREIAVEKEFTGDKFFSKLTGLISEGLFQGIKLYPALGFFPFDKRLKKVYDFALEYRVPLITHCSTSMVHLKYRPAPEERYHPILKTQLPDLKPAALQCYFTHPLNYECLLNQSLLARYWGNDTPDYRNLKICLAHWGGEDQWYRFLEDAWTETAINVKTGKYPSLNLDNWNIKPKDAYKNFSWFSIICDLMRKYPNVYADISYTLSHPDLLTLLKMTLEADPKIRERVLFGTDFYMVSKATTERLFGINARAFLGEELFYQIAKTNAERFLENDVALDHFPVFVKNQWFVSI